MNELTQTGLNAYVEALKRQRQQALDDVAALSAVLAEARARIAELEAAAVTPPPPPPV
jgi:hypothetical protein